MSVALFHKLHKVFGLDPKVFCKKEEVVEVLGSNPDYLLELGLTKSDLIRLERLGLAVKARYVVEKTKMHRVRWLLFTEALSV